MVKPPWGGCWSTSKSLLVVLMSVPGTGQPWGGFAKMKALFCTMVAVAGGGDAIVYLVRQKSGRERENVLMYMLERT